MPNPKISARSSPAFNRKEACSHNAITKIGVNFIFKEAGLSDKSTTPDTCGTSSNQNRMFIFGKEEKKEPVYVKALLKISREYFTGLLSNQIEKGTDLLKIVTQQLFKRAAPYGSMYSYGSSRQNDKVEYDNASKSDFMSQYSMWDDFNKEIYQSSFTEPNNTYWRQYESQS